MISETMKANKELVEEMKENFFFLSANIMDFLLVKSASAERALLNHKSAIEETRITAKNAVTIAKRCEHLQGHKKK